MLTSFAKEYAPTVSQAIIADDFFRLLVGLFADLHNGHTELLNRSTIFGETVTCELIEGRLLITDIGTVMLFPLRD